jgi:hypothetical protein
MGLLVLPQFLGMLLLLGTVMVLALVLSVALWAAVRRNRAVLRRALLVAAGMTGIYGVFWLGGLALTRRVVLAPGESLSFCGLDCHLHVSVDGVRRGEQVGVTVRFSSNALRAPEWPDALRFRLRDASGTEYAPSDAPPNNPVLAGQSWTHELHFPRVARTEGAQLIVTWGGWLDYLVPGEGNPLVQRQRRLALPSAEKLGAR